MRTNNLTCVCGPKGYYNSLNNNDPTTTSAKLKNRTVNTGSIQEMSAAFMKNTINKRKFVDFMYKASCSLLKTYECRMYLPIVNDPH